MSGREGSVEKGLVKTDKVSFSVHFKVACMVQIESHFLPLFSKKNDEYFLLISNESYQSKLGSDYVRICLLCYICGLSLLLTRMKE